MQSAGHTLLIVEELLGRILGHTVWGDFLYGYRFVSYCDTDGTMEGTNNVGSYNTGRWEVDRTADTSSVQWNQTWVPATLRAYDVGGILHFQPTHWPVALDLWQACRWKTAGKLCDRTFPAHRNRFEAGLAACLEWQYSLDTV